MNFFLGVSITLNIFLIIFIILYFKIKKFLNKKYKINFDDFFNQDKELDNMLDKL